jgi:hypothetical protein
MFQYAAGRALALRLGVELKLDISWFSSIPAEDTPRLYMLGEAFSVSAAIADREECDKLRPRKAHSAMRFLRHLFKRARPHAGFFIVEPCYAYWAGFGNIVSPAYLNGYWQNECYFKAVEGTIRQDFSFLELLSGEGKAVARRIVAEPNAVSVHVRRGDYASNPKTYRNHGLCSQEYYRRALTTVASKSGGDLGLFFFSDDPSWVHEHFDCLGFPAHFVDFQEHVSAPWHDMHLMSLCKHHIIANSSFSWWGAWLAGKGGVTCAPRQWFAATEKKNDNSSPGDWILL